jgi:hypothetical protein
LSNNVRAFWLYYYRRRLYVTGPPGEVLSLHRLPGLKELPNPHKVDEQDVKALFDCVLHQKERQLPSEVLRAGCWVRIARGRYKRDLGLVLTVFPSQFAEVAVIPRIRLDPLRRERPNYESTDSDSQEDGGSENKNEQGEDEVDEADDMFDLSGERDKGKGKEKDIGAADSIESEDDNDDESEETFRAATSSRVADAQRPRHVSIPIQTRHGRSLTLKDKTFKASSNKRKRTGRERQLLRNEKDFITSGQKYTIQDGVLVWQKRRFKQGHELIRVDAVMGIKQEFSPEIQDLESFNSPELAISPDVVTEALIQSIKRTWRQGRPLIVQDGQEDVRANLISIDWHNDARARRAIVRCEDGRDLSLPLHQVNPLICVGHRVSVSLGPSKGALGYVTEIDVNQLATVVPRENMEDITKPKVQFQS